MKFDQYDITPEIKNNLQRLHFKRPTDIQYKSIPSILNGEDVLAVAQTGTGKTAAFAIPVIDLIHRYKSSRRSLGIKCIVMVPTRELAMQIGTVFNTLAKHTRVKAFALYGGVEQDAQIQKLQDGLDILIATPGRMFDLIHQQFINLNNIEILVLDEADRMLDLGFIEDIKFIKRLLKKKHQTLFFSATINPEIKKLAYSQVKGNAVRIQISPKDPVSKNVSHFVMFIEMDDKRFFLARFIKENPNRKILVFVRTRVRAERVAKAMLRESIETSTLHGEKEQEQRSAVMQKFRESRNGVLIATDVSARGIDVPDVTYVINYDLPDVAENYVHRVGRTGRGVKKGVAISFCSEGEKPLLHEIEKLVTKKIEVIKITKKNYSFTLESSKNDGMLQKLIDEDEILPGKKPKKKIKKPKKKRSK
ncbi:MAG: ATP-dependent helicase [Calditrichaeota bacterium]|nr:MAG: ATP-dependent helicase [Calditrichota bacterium]